MKKVFIIAEAGVNHNGSLQMAKDLIDAAANTGADAIKFQSFRTENCLSTYAPKADYQKRTTSIYESQFEMVKKLELSQEDHSILMDHCKNKKIQFLSTAFDLESLALLANYNLPLFKIASGEITNSLLLLRTAQLGKPIILSTGMSFLGDIEVALGILAWGYLGDKSIKINSQNLFEMYRTEVGQEVLKKYVTLLHCTTEYPAPFAEVNLRVLETLKTSFNLRIGYSDHTVGIEIPIAAVALGATVIEKHFTLDRNLEGPDHKASLEPQEFTQMVKSIRNIEEALGYGNKIPGQAEFKNRKIARKSLVALCEIQEGEMFTEKNLGIKRPGDGISAFYYWEVIGKAAKYHFNTDDLITL